MGCGHSGVAAMHGTNQQLDAYLTQEEVRFVKQSWKLIRDDLTATGLMVFRKLFASQRSLKSLFLKMMKKSENGEMDFENEKLKRHATIVMEGLGAAVESLEDSIFLTNVLMAMGERHGTYNVKPEMVSHLWPAIRETFREKLGEDFSPEVEQAWSHVFEYVESKFKDGIRNTKTTQPVA